MNKLKVSTRLTRMAGLLVSLLANRLVVAAPADSLKSQLQQRLQAVAVFPLGAADRARF